MLATISVRTMEAALFFSMQHPLLLRVSGVLFRVFAGLATILRPLSPQVAAAVCCSGPFGAGPCPSSYCSSGSCGSAHCVNATGYCYTSPTNCWTNGLGICDWPGCFGCLCCDCYCTDPDSVTYYCYCSSC